MYIQYKKISMHSQLLEMWGHVLQFVALLTTCFRPGDEAMVLFQCRPGRCHTRGPQRRSATPGPGCPGVSAAVQFFRVFCRSNQQKLLENLWKSMKIAGKSMKIFSLTFPDNSDFWLRNLHVLVGISISLLNSATQKTRLPTQGLLSSLAIATTLVRGLVRGALLELRDECVWSCGISKWTYGYLWYPMVICVSV